MLSTYVDELYNYIRGCDFKIMVAHYDVHGARYSEIDPLSNSFLMIYKLKPMSLRPDHFDYIALGHIHIYQEIPGYKHMVYAGSLDRVNFGEVDDKKGFVVIDIEEGGVDKKFIPVNPIKMIVTPVIELDAENPVGSIINHLDSLEIGESLIRLRVRGDSLSIKAIRDDYRRLDKYIVEDRGGIGYRVDDDRISFRVDIGDIEFEAGSDWLLDMMFRYIESLDGLEKWERERMRDYLVKLFESLGDVGVED
jgi:exonuclease SbcD